MLGLAVAAAALGAGATGIPLEPGGWIVAYCGIVVVGLRVRGMYALRLDPSLIDDVVRVVSVTAAAALAVIAMRVIVESDPNSARQTLRLWAFSAVYVSAGRAGIALAVRRSRRRGEGAQSTVIVGGGQVGRRIAKRLMERPEIGLRPVGFIDKDPLPAKGTEGPPVLGASWDLERLVVEHDVRYAVVSFSTAPHEVLLDVLRRCQELDVAVLMVPRLFEGVNHRMYVDHLGGLPILGVRPIDPRGWQFALKYAMDRVAALVLLLGAAPVLAAAMVAVKLSSPGPVLFAQQRMGRDGVSFEMLKIRTMVSTPVESGEADAAWAAAVVSAQRERALDGEDAVDPLERRTRVGAFLRRHSLDELPQLWNVLRGEMSLVGPRPERVSYVRRFEDAVYRYGDRHRVKAGLTGWAQVHGFRGSTSLSDRVEWDNYYIENFSLLLDLKILLMTIPAIFRPGE